MKKSTLLTVASVGAVALTSAMTFAAWDTLHADSNEAVVTFKQINVTKDANTTLTLDSTENTNLLENYAPSAEGTVKFNVEGLTELNGTKLTFTPTVTNSNGDSVLDNVEVKIYEGANKETDVTGGDTTLTNGNDYTVVVTPKTSDADVSALANKELKVKVTATLEKVTQ